MIYTGTTEVGVHGVIAFLIPDLDFWGVIVDGVSATSTAPILTQADILDIVRETVFEALKNSNIQGHSSFHRGNRLENARYVRRVDEIEVSDSPQLSEIINFSAVYLSPFSDVTGKNLIKLTLEPLPKHPTSRLRVKIIANASQVATSDLIIDHKRNGFFLIRPDGSVGEEVMITSEYVSLPNDEIFIEESVLMPKLQEYQAIIKTIKEKAKNDIFNGPISTTNKAIAPPTSLAVTTQPPPPISRDNMPTTSSESPESTQNQIGIRFGTVLGAAALGGLAGAGIYGLSRALWYGPYSPYGYYPRTPFAPGTVWYGPGSMYGMYPPNLWFGMGSPYGMYPPVGLPSYVRWYGSGSPWGYRRPITNRVYNSSRWGPNWRGSSYGTRGGGYRIGYDGRGGSIRPYRR
jgi:hypothetical protein